MQAERKLKLSDVATLTGSGLQTVRDWIEGKKLRATQGSRGRKEWFVTRSDLVDWLVNGGWTAQQIRSALLPIDGCVILVGDPPGLEWIDLNPVREDTLFGLGVSVGTMPAKVVVVDFYGEMLFAASRFEVFARQVDRPVFVGLVTGYNVTACSRVCDLVFDREMSAHRVLAAVNKLLNEGG